MQFDDRVKAIALNRLLVYYPTFRKRVVAEFDRVSSLFDLLWDIEGGETALKYGKLGYRSKEELLKSCTKELLWAESRGVSILIAGDPLGDYPKKLMECNDYPIILYKRGRAKLRDSRFISIVGTRRATRYGIEMCQKIVEKISIVAPNTIIVSGLAFGIDIQAHKSALKYNLPTVAILGCAPDQIYPASHTNWSKMIVEKGALLTELPKGSAFMKLNYIRRNRIIAGISDLLIVIESGERGGSLITASMANCYNREVFALPGRVDDTLSKGCNLLIANNRANLFTTVEEMFNQLGWERAPIIASPTDSTLFDTPINEEKIKILVTLQQLGEPSVERIAQSVGIEIGKLLSLLVELELEGRIEALEGKRYKIAGATV
ncbi:MAG: DNA-processing protein DprA [Bacteroidales bacterium]